MTSVGENSKVCWLVVFAVCLLAGCGGGAGSGEPSQPSPAFNPTAIGYVANVSSNTVSSFLLDERTGALSQGTTAPTGAGPGYFVVTPDRRFLFVSNMQDKTISRFVLDGMGGMQPTGVAVHLVSPGTPWDVQVDQSGKFLLVATTNVIEVFSIDGTTGDLAPVPSSPFTIASGDVGFVRTHSGHTILAATSDAFYPLTIDPTTGRLTQLPAGPTHTGYEPGGFAVDMSDKYLFVVAPQAQKILAYAIQPSGALQLSATSLLPSNLLTIGPVVAPNNHFLYLADPANSNGILAYSFDPGSGGIAPVSGSPFPDRQVPSSVAVSPDSSILAVSRMNPAGPGHVASYRIDPQTGALSSISGNGFDSGVATGKDPNHVVLVPK